MERDHEMSLTRPEFSVVIPAYNSAEFINDTK